MALVFNPYSLETLNNYMNTGNKQITPIGGGSGNSNLYIYSSSSVAYPNGCPNTAPAGHLAVFANISNTAWTLNSGVLFLSTSQFANANLRGTADWWLAIRYQLQVGMEF